MQHCKQSTLLPLAANQQNHLTLRTGTYHKLLIEEWAVVVVPALRPQLRFHWSSLGAPAGVLPQPLHVETFLPPLFPIIRGILRFASTQLTLLPATPSLITVCSPAPLLLLPPHTQTLSLSLHLRCSGHAPAANCPCSASLYGFSHPQVHKHSSFVGSGFVPEHDPCKPYIN